jgi:hypothetical protein
MSKKIVFMPKKFIPDVTVCFFTEFNETTKTGKWTFTIDSAKITNIKGTRSSSSQEELDLLTVIDMFDFMNNKYNNILIYTNSIYVKCCINEWISLWKINNFDISEDFLIETKKKRPYWKLLSRIAEYIDKKKIKMKEFGNGTHPLVRYTIRA